MFFRRKDRGGGGAVAEAEQAGGTRRSIESELSGTGEELAAEIRELSGENRGQRDPAKERRLLDLRHLAGVRMLEDAGRSPDHPEPDFDALPDSEGLPDIPAGQATPELLRAGILRDGSFLVRGMIPRERALAFAELIDRVY